ncbi:MAG: acetate--CoA ligase family protein [Paracoccaceae bacterium]
MQSLSRLLRPRSIAVVGGGAWGANVIRECRRIGYEGALRAVHPSRPEIEGVAACRDVAALPEAPDAAYVAVNGAASVEVVRALAARGAGGAVCFASGFAEAEAEIEGSDGLQAALVAAAGDMRLLGPNCYGVLNLLDRVALWPDRHGARSVETGVAVVTQSSNIAINLTMQRRGLPLACVVTAGNQAQTGLAEIGVALLEEPRVTALGLHVEGLGEAARFEALADAARRTGKPVVALKSGRSARGRAAGLTHTASLMGSDAGADALLDRLRIARVGSLSVLLEMLKLLHHVGPLPSIRIASMSCSGGEAGLMADAGEAAGLDFPAPEPRQRARLRAVLGPRVALANPLDYHTYVWGDRAAMAETFAAMLDGDVAMGCLVLDFPREDVGTPPEWEAALDAAAEARAREGKPLAVVSTLADTMPETRAREIAGRGLGALSGLDDALAAIAAAARLGAGRPAVEPVLAPRPPRRPLATPSEAEGKALVAAHGLGVPDGRRARCPESAARVARAIGFPVALKGEGAAHKTEAGAVALGLASPEAVARAAAAMTAPGFLVERMVEGVIAELCLGVVLDPPHGYALTLASGGTRAEIHADRVTLLVPSMREAVRDALGRLRLAPVLAGWRGAPPVATEAIVDAVMALQAFVVAEHGRLDEVEINPLLCTAGEAVAADVLIRLGERA